MIGKDQKVFVLSGQIINIPIVHPYAKCEEQEPHIKTGGFRKKEQFSPSICNQLVSNQGNNEERYDNKNKYYDSYILPEHLHFCLKNSDLVQIA